MRGCPHPKTDPRPYLCPLPSFRHKTQFTIRSIFWDDCVGKGGYFWFQFQGCFTCFALQTDYHLLAAFNSLFPHTSQHDGHEDKSRIKESTFTRLKVSSSVVKGKNLTFDQKRVMSSFWNQFRGENKIGELDGLQVASYLRICSCIELKLLQAEARPGSHCCHSLALRLAIRPLSHKDTDRRHLRASRLHFPQNQQMELGDEARQGALFSRGGLEQGDCLRVYFALLPFATPCVSVRYCFSCH